MKAGFFPQLKTMLWRNILLKKRNKSQLIQEIVYPIMYIGILAGLRAGLKPSVKPPMSFPSHHLDTFFSLGNGSTILVTAPGDFDVHTTMSAIAAGLGFSTPPANFYKYFASQKEAETEFLKSGTNIGIIFDYVPSSGSTADIQYAIRLPKDQIPGKDQTFTPDRGSCRGSDNAQGTGLGQCSVNQYLISGFARLQSVIDKVLIQNKTSTPLPEIGIEVQMMPKEEFTPNLEFLQTFSSIYFVLAYSFFVNFLTVNLVAEKEKKIREGMLMMGLRNSVFWLSWSTVYFIIILVVTAIVTLMAALAKFFENSNMFLLFVVLMLYGLSIIAFGFLLTPFFKKAKPAGIFASFATILLSLAYLIVSQTRKYEDGSVEYTIPSYAPWLMCLMSPCALALAIDQGLYLDVSKGGMNFDTINEGFFPLSAPLLMLLVDVVLYFLLAIYLDHVIPGEYGPRYSPLYFLQPSYWCPNEPTLGETSYLMNGLGAGDNEDVVSGPNIEPVSADMRSKRTLRIVNISKEFKSRKETTVAVNELSLDMYEGQITALLGHNGAGKTTLINMLTGVMVPTSGTATINGLDVTSSGAMEEIRTMCGICPQHNILYDELSAREHLHIFAGIKGVPLDKIPKAATKALKDVDLEDQANVLASKLSGGQKRKLSVAMALIGDPKIIFLDEPTAGMDPYSRRHLWSLLKSSKEGRVILLTTHFMDEADILADRKAMISKGKLQCVGSSLFLKNKFGIGYHLNMVVEPNCDESSVTSFLRSHVTGVEYNRSHGKELAYTIPLAEVGNFANLFKALEQRGEGGKTKAQSLSILNYGVSMPTLEEVFLKLEEEEETSNGSATENLAFSSEASVLKASKKTEQIHLDVHSGTMNPSELLPTLREEENRTLQCFIAIVLLRLRVFMRSPAAVIFMFILPIGLVVGALLINKNSPENTNVPEPLFLTAEKYAELSGINNTLPAYILFDSVKNATSQQYEDFFRASYKVDKPGAVSLSDVRPHFLGTVFSDSMAQVMTSYTALYNDTAIHSLPAIINAMSNALLSSISSAAANITVYSLPWPKKDNTFYDGGAFGSALMIGIAFTLIAPAFGVNVVIDKQWKCKSQLRVSGLSFHMYWGTTYLFSLVVYLIPATVCLILVLAMQVPSFTTTGGVLMLILLFITFIPACLMLSLICSFFFDKFETAQAVLPNLFIWAGMAPYTAVSVLDMLLTGDTGSILHYIFLFIDPVYNIFGGFYFIDKVYRTSLFEGRDTTLGEYFKFENNILICLLANLFHLLLGYFLLRILEVKSNGGTVREALKFGSSNLVRNTPAENPDKVSDEESDVAKERERVEMIEHSGASSQDTVAYIRQLRKVFTKRGSGQCGKKKEADKHKVAVRNLSFAVNRGEVFGLLGPNGAGKTTALNMMTGEVHPSQGKVVVADHQICSNMSEAFKDLGFCPQHDALWEPVKLHEHLEVYAAIKGIKQSDIPVIADFFMEHLHLQEHRNKNAKKLSGGTKRKLSYALAMLGSPQVVLLDEPSTGMDPKSKRFLWDTISSSFEGSNRGAILTTHYMEEADALCSRVAIMVNGEMECIGPTQHLKSKYGSGYLLEVKLGGFAGASNEMLEERIQNLERHLLTMFPNATCLESFAERAQYKIPSEDVSVLSATFAALESTKETHGVEEYSFSQSTLEQVFLNFAKKQLEEGEDVENLRTKRVLGRQLSSDPNSHAKFQGAGSSVSPYVNERL